MNTDQRRLASGSHVTHPQDHAFFHRAGIGPFEAVNAEMAKSAGEIGFGDFAKHGSANRGTGLHSL
jgi:hypothetical protein